MIVPILGLRAAIDPLASFPERHHVRGGWMVATHCLFPNGDQVAVLVRRDAARGRSIVSDGGAAWEALFAAGMDPDSRPLVTSATAAAEDAGLRFAAGEFFFAEVPDEELPGAIISLANVAQGWVVQTVARAKPATEVTLEGRLLEVLDRQFGPAAVTAGAEVSGDSTRSYEMTAVVRLPAGRVGLFRAVQQHATSLYSCTTAFGDIGRVDRSASRIAVISGQDHWPAADITLLGQSATHILDVERAPELALRRLAAA